MTKSVPVTPGLELAIINCLENFTLREKLEEASNLNVLL